jgi:hypothetical protein
MLPAQWWQSLLLGIRITILQEEHQLDATQVLITNHKIGFAWAFTMLIKR